MNYYFMPVALIVAVLLIFILSLVLKRPLKGFGYIFLILFLGTWVGQVWIAPFGPVAMGIAWVPLGFISLMLFFLILALSPNASLRKKKEDEDEAEAPLIVAGFFFWLLIFLLILAIGAGFFKQPEIIA
ncbi:MAG: hypothetical protein K0S33_1943 [Bacteroidetes bacterium]|jgi:hypothetical protein|nr:hypothetical protein [Bacteroidota bacterium]